MDLTRLAAKVSLIFWETTLMVEYDSQVYLLSSKFISDYPLSRFPELMYKQGRPYACLLIETHDGYFLCVPFRSSINHNNAFLFTGTRRSQASRSGLDYSKTIVINNSDYIDSSVRAIVDNDEYSEMMRNLPKIVSDELDYVNTYISHKDGTATLHPREYKRRYGYSTLPYFVSILGV